MKITYAKKSASRLRRAFTLVELLLVMTILAILAGIVLPKMAGKGQEAREKANLTQMDAFKTALNMFEVDNGYYPAGRQGLSALVQKPRDAQNWHGPYIEKDTVPAGPWGNPYVYECPGKHNPGSFDIYTTDQNGTVYGNWTVQH